MISVIAAFFAGIVIDSMARAIQHAVRKKLRADKDKAERDLRRGEYA